MRPRVSIVIPSYNRRAVIGASIDTCLEQTFTDLEVLVVDDASKDDTADFVRTTYAGEPRVRLFVLEDNQGTAGARNHGIDHARGEYMGMLDSDDLYLPEFVGTHVAALDRHADVDLTISDARYEGAWPKGRTTVFARRAPPTSGDMMCQGAWVVPCTLMARGHVLQKLRFQHRVAEDSDLMFRFFEAGYRVRVLPEVLSVYRRLGTDAGEVQLTIHRRAFRKAALEYAEKYAHLADDPDAHRVRLTRRRARFHLRFGPQRDALSWALRWWRRRPFDRHAAWSVARASLGQRRNHTCADE